MNESKMNVTLDEVIEYIETRIHSNNASEKIEDLYIEYQRYGKEVFKFPENKGLVSKIVKAVKREYGLEE